ncbi:hypothetical protein AAGS61_08625 [Lysinibacillus sp. KU-BSD001]|uniref:hypothetical protein n=1 Tax=Lysinibacillus sp. KU-BSD001 TaxID=3141328 RepID=UPI0036E048A8
MSTEEMKVALDAAPDKCLITGLEKCTSYMIDGNVVYLPRPAYDAYTLPEYIVEEKAFHQIKYDMDNDFVEVENGELCTLEDLILDNHPNLAEIKRFYNIPQEDFFQVLKSCILGWQLTFHLEGFPNHSMHGFVSASNEQQAIEKFKSDYPNLADCIITEVARYEAN